MCHVIIFYALIFALITETEFLQPSTIITVRVRFIGTRYDNNRKTNSLTADRNGPRLGKLRGSKDNS